MKIKNFTFVGDVKKWITNDFKTIDTIYFEKVIDEFIKNNHITNYSIKEINRIHQEGKCKVVMQLIWDM